MSEQTLRSLIADKMFARQMGERHVCERVADALLPIIRSHAAEVARNIEVHPYTHSPETLGRVTEALEAMS